MQRQVPLLPGVMQLFEIMSRVSSPAEGHPGDEVSEQLRDGIQAPKTPVAGESDLDWSGSETDRSESD
jgi:hypothetical protein